MPRARAAWPQVEWFFIARKNSSPTDPEASGMSEPGSQILLTKLVVSPCLFRGPDPVGGPRYHPYDLVRQRHQGAYVVSGDDHRTPLVRHGSDHAGHQLLVLGGKARQRLIRQQAGGASNPGQSHLSLAFLSTRHLPHRFVHEGFNAESGRKGDSGLLREPSPEHRKMPLGASRAGEGVRNPEGRRDPSPPAGGDGG